MKTLSLMLATTLGIVFASLLPADEGPQDSTASRLEAAKKQVAGQEYELKYQFADDETVRNKVVQLVTVETKIQGSKQTAKTRTISTKLWKVTDVDDEGNATFVYSVESVDMWNQVSGRSEVTYNSEKDATPPPGYEPVAKSVGVPLAVITIDPHGKILKRENKSSQLGEGGQIIAPLPPSPVKVGAKWFSPLELVVRLKSGVVRRIKTRQQFRLEKVDAGIATISIHTQVLTPTDDPKIKVQLVQRLTHGWFRFDIDAGRIVSQELALDETVIGFNGADSIMQYVGRFTEELVEEAKTARKTAGPARRE